MQSKEKKSPNPKSVNPAYQQAGAKDAKGKYPSTQRKGEVQVIRKPIHLLKQVMKDEQVCGIPVFYTIDKMIIRINGFNQSKINQISNNVLCCTLWKKCQPAKTLRLRLTDSFQDIQADSSP